MENNIVTSQDKAFTLPSSGFQTKAAAPGEASSLISSAGNLNGKLGSFMEIDDPNAALQINVCAPTPNTNATKPSPINALTMNARVNPRSNMR